MMASPARRRASSKRAVPGVPPPAPPVSHQAIEDEGCSELVALSPGVKRKHIHWAHVRTSDPSHVQPDQMTRQQFVEHLEKVYEDVYPEPANATGSILVHSRRFERL